MRVIGGRRGDAIPITVIGVFYLMDHHHGLWLGSQALARRSQVYDASRSGNGHEGGCDADGDQPSRQASLLRFGSCCAARLRVSILFVGARAVLARASVVLRGTCAPFDALRGCSLDRGAFAILLIGFLSFF